MRAWMLVGLPGSGKSTWASKKNDYALMSTDLHLEEYAAESGRTYSEVFANHFPAAEMMMYGDLGRAAMRGVDIIWDQTNLTIKSRRSKLDTLLRMGYHDVTAVFFDVPLQLASDRVRDRFAVTGKYVPAKVIENMYKTIQKPTVSEGFSSVITERP